MRAPFESLSEPLLKLGEDYAQGLIDAATYNREYEALIVACGWTYEEFVLEIDRRWDLDWTNHANPKC